MQAELLAVLGGMKNMKKKRQTVKVLFNSFFIVVQLFYYFFLSALCLLYSMDLFLSFLITIIPIIHP